MMRLAAIGGAFLIGCALTAPAEADVHAVGEKVTPAAPGCNCPLVVHRRVHARVRHHQIPPPAVAVREGPDYYNFLIPSPYDSAFDRVVVDHFRTPDVTGFDEPWRPKPVWPGILPYRVQAGDGGVLQYDGLIGRYVPLAHEDAALVAAALPPPPPPK